MPTVEIATQVVRPTGAGFDLVLIAHVGVALLCLVQFSLLAVGAFQIRTSPTDGFPQWAKNFFRPGTNWAGRSVHLLPVLGLVLVGLSKGAYSLSHLWVEAGIALYLGIAGVAEGWLFPAEQTLKASLKDEDVLSAKSAARSVERAVGVLWALMLVAIVVMFAQF
jgi:hypothetical protein